MLATTFENCLENTISIIIILIFQSAINYILIDHQGCVLGMYKKNNNILQHYQLFPKYEFLRFLSLRNIKD